MQQCVVKTFSLRNPSGFFFPFEQPLGWLLSLFFVAGITGLVKSER